MTTVKGLGRADFERRSDTEQQCRAYPAEQKWGNGFVCKACGYGSAYKGKKWSHWALFARFHTGLNIGVDETSSKVGINVYPNPFTDVLKVESSKQLHGLTVTDAFGRTVHAYQSRPCATGLDLRHLAPGLYPLAAMCNGQYVSRTLVRQ